MPGHANSIARIAKVYCLLIPSLIFFTLSAQSPVLAQSGDPAAEQRADELIEQLRNAQGKGVDVWGVWIRELIELGPPAVEPVCEALRATEAPWDLSVYGFVLRGIGDPRAVPALIEAIPKTLLPIPRESVGPRKVSDPGLLEFLVMNSATAEPKMERDVSAGFTFGGPSFEILSALNEITGHSINEKELFFIGLSGSPAQQYMKRELVQKNAQLWKVWWELHSHEFNTPEAFRNINLPEFATERPEVIDVFASGRGIPTEAWVLILSPIESGTNRVFLDLDTGRMTGLPAEMDSSMASAEEIFQWASENRFDLYCCSVTLPGSDKPIHAIRAVDLELWQNDSFEYDKIYKEFRVPDGPGTPVREYLIGKNPETGILDPEDQAIFLFRTADGTCGAIKYICIVDQVVPPEELKGRPIQDIPHNTYTRPGVKIEAMVFDVNDD